MRTERIASGSRRLVVVVLSVVLGAFSIGHAALSRSWPDPDATRSPRPTKAASLVVSQLRRTGVRLSGRQQQALRALVGVWDARADLQRSFPAAHGRAPLPSLISWALASSDYGALTLAGWRHDLVGVSDRIGLMRPEPTGRDVDVVAYLLALAEERVRPQGSVRPAMWELIRAWRARPELRARFVTEGVVRARALLLWGFTLGPDDPSFAALRPVAASLERWYRDLPVGARRAGV